MTGVNRVSVRSRLIASLICISGLIALSTGPVMGQSGRTPWEKPVPQARCGPQDHVETGLQGQTTLAERFGGDSEKAYNCNLELVSQFQGEGAGIDLADVDNCVYHPSSTTPNLRNPGTRVLDVSDPKRPTAAAYLDSPAMLSNQELLDAHDGRKLLASVRSGGPEVEIYDVNSDCRRPALKGTLALTGDFKAHASALAPDGRTFYITDFSSRPSTYLSAVDITDPSKPREITRFSSPLSETGIVHHVAMSRDGNRAYVGISGWAEAPFNGIAILDSSEVQSRRPNPQLRLISTFFWPEGAAGQVPIPVTISGRPYLVFSDAGVPGGLGAPGVKAACARTMPPHGFARIVDISDEKNPKLTAKLMLEVDDPAACSKVAGDPIYFVGYSSLFCAADNPQNARMIACAFHEGGLRVFDVRDPYRPREIAYYKPAGRRPAQQTASGERTRALAGTDGVNFPSFRSNGDIWFTSWLNGFQVVKFSDRFKAQERGLFR